MKFRNNDIRRAWWTKHVLLLRQSGLSLRDYCRQHGISETSLSQYRSTLDYDAQRVTLVEGKIAQCRAEIAALEERIDQWQEELGLWRDVEQAYQEAFVKQPKSGE